MKVAVIGCGIGFHHARIYAELAKKYDIERIAISSISEGKAKFKCKELSHILEEKGIKIPFIPYDGFSDSYKKMIEKEKPSIVSICSPPSAHTENLEFLLNFDDIKSIYCEKPFADISQELRVKQIVKEIKGKNILFGMNINLAAFYEILKDKDLGSFNGSKNYSDIAFNYDSFQSTWSSVPKTNGNIILDLGSHVLTLPKKQIDKKSMKSSGNGDCDGNNTKIYFKSVSSENVDNEVILAYKAKISDCSRQWNFEKENLRHIFTYQNKNLITNKFEPVVLYKIKNTSMTKELYKKEISICDPMAFSMERFLQENPIVDINNALLNFEYIYLALKNG